MRPTREMRPRAILSVGLGGTIGPIAHPHTAEGTEFDPSISGIDSEIDTVQEAIDFVLGLVPSGGAGWDPVTAPVSNPPTEAELTAALGDPAGYVGRPTQVIDSDTDRRYLAVSDGLRYAYIPLILADVGEDPEPPAPGAFTITAAPQGGWQQYPQPSAIYDATADVTYIAYVRGNSGSIGIVAYDHATATTGTEFILASSLNKDLHAAPAVILRDDGKIVVYYSAHNGTSLFQRISSSAHDISAFGAATNLDSQLAGFNYTYPFAALLTGGDLFLSFRPVSGAAGQTWSYSTSTDDGSTWASKTDWFRQTGRWSYPRPSQTSGTRIDFFVDDGQAGTDSNISIRHCYYEGGDFYLTDGTLIVASMPFDKDDLTLVYGGTGFSCRSGELVLNGSDEPRGVIQQVVANGDVRYLYARWTPGDGWETFEITDDAEFGTGTGSGGATIDPVDPSVVWVSKVVSGVMEIWRYETADDGETWAGEAITVGSSVHQLKPHVPRDRATELGVVWTAGTEVSSTNWSQGVKGAAVA